MIRVFVFGKCWFWPPQLSFFYLITPSSGLNHDFSVSRIIMNWRNWGIFFFKILPNLKLCIAKELSESQNFDFLSMPYAPKSFIWNIAQCLFCLSFRISYQNHEDNINSSFLFWLVFAWLSSPKHLKHIKVGNADIALYFIF